MNENNTHRLTETAAAELWDAHRTPNTFPFHDQRRPYVQSQTAMLRAAFDAGREHERTAPEDALPWEPLNGNPVRVGDEVRREADGLTATAVVGRVDKDGDPWTAEGAFIGRIDVGTWHVRRAGQELPTEDGAVIVPAEGHEFITMTDAEGWAFDRMTYSARYDRWYGMTTRGAIAMCLAEQVTPGTWRAA